MPSVVKTEASAARKRIDSMIFSLMWREAR